jgi:hypothetical protein
VGATGQGVSLSRSSPNPHHASRHLLRAKFDSSRDEFPTETA